MGQSKVDVGTKKAALTRRQGLLKLKQLQDLKDALVGRLFDKQREVALANEMFTVLLCGRRSGKSHLMAYMIVLALLDCKANEHVWFCAMSAKKAQEIIWETLFKIIVEYRLREDWSWDVNESQHTIKTPAGGQFKLLGVSEERNIDKVRGNKYRLFLCDEASTYDDLLGPLIVEGVAPALGEAVDPRYTNERVGRIVVAGTPNGILAGKFYELSTGLANPPDTPEHEKWKIRTWTMVDNPHYLRPEEFMETQRRINGWTPDHPTFLQEYKAKWVANTDILVMSEWYPTPKESLVETAGLGVWTHYIGIDYGFSPDFCAAVVIAKRRGCPWARVVHVWKANKLDDVEFAMAVKELVDRYRPLDVVGDTAGAGSRAIAMFNTRYSAATGVFIRAADKAHKKTRMDIVRTQLRRKSLYIDDTIETEPLRLELATLRWRDALREELDPRCDDHAFDALNYAVMVVHEMLDTEVDRELSLRASNNEEAELEMERECEEELARIEEEREFLDDLY